MMSSPMTEESFTSQSPKDLNQVSNSKELPGFSKREVVQVQPAPDALTKNRPRAFKRPLPKVLESYVR